MQETLAIYPLFPCLMTSVNIASIFSYQRNIVTSMDSTISLVQMIILVSCYKVFRAPKELQEVSEIFYLYPGRLSENCCYHWDKLFANLLLDVQCCPQLELASIEFNLNFCFSENNPESFSSNPGFSFAEQSFCYAYFHPREANALCE